MSGVDGFLKAAIRYENLGLPETANHLLEKALEVEVRLNREENADG